MENRSEPSFIFVHYIGIFTLSENFSNPNQKQYQNFINKLYNLFVNNCRLW